VSDYTHGSEELTEGQARYYTPTTGAIRTDYANVAQFGLDMTKHRYEEFDRWLESNMQKMQIAERERIIKLLEAEGSSIFSLPYVIALIKGENK
jgi:hypothetical protein